MRTSCVRHPQAFGWLIEENAELSAVSRLAASRYAASFLGGYSTTG